MIERVKVGTRFSIYCANYDKIVKARLVEVDVGKAGIIMEESGSLWSSEKAVQRVHGATEYTVTVKELRVMSGEGNDIFLTEEDIIKG